MAVKTELDKLKLLIEVLKDNGITYYKKGTMELKLKDEPVPFEKTIKDPINKPDFFDTNSWAKQGVTR